MVAIHDPWNLKPKGDDESIHHLLMAMMMKKKNCISKKEENFCTRDYVNQQRLSCQSREDVIPERIF
jgi:hypothetical protein